VYKVRDTKLGREVAVVGGNVALEIPEQQKEFTGFMSVFYKRRQLIDDEVSREHYPTCSHICKVLIPGSGADRDHQHA